MSQRMSRPAVELSVAVLMLGLAACSEGRLRAFKDVREDCPSRCECNLSKNPHILCRELFSLPGSIPQEAESFKCAQCPIAKMTGNTFHNYTNLKEISLEGNSRPIFDEQSLEFLRSVPKLVLEEYELSPSDFLSLVEPNRTLVVRISLVTTTTTTTTLSVSSTYSGYDYSSTARTTSPAKTGESVGSTTPRAADNRSVGGGGSSNNTRSATVDDKDGIPNTTTPVINIDARKIEESTFANWVMGISFTVMVVLAAALTVTTVRTCMRRKETRPVDPEYTQITPPNTLTGHLKKSWGKATEMCTRERS